MLLGGVLTDTLGWEWVLWVNVPIGIGAAAVAPTLIAESRSTSQTRTSTRWGAVTVTAGLSILVYALVDATDAGWGSTQTIGLLALSARCWPRSSRSSCARRRRSCRSRSSGCARSPAPTWSGLLVGASLFSMFFFISLYMQQVLGYSPIKSGFSYLPLALTIIVSAGIASQLVTRVGFKPVLVAGMAFVAAGLLWFSQVSVGGGYVRTCSARRCWRPSGSASPS